VEVLDPTTKEFHEMMFVAGAGWVWQGATYDDTKAENFEIRLTSADGQVMVVGGWRVVGGGGGGGGGLGGDLIVCTALPTSALPHYYY